MKSKNDPFYLKIMIVDLTHAVRLCKYLNNKYLRRDMERKLSDLYRLINQWIRELSE